MRSKKISDNSGEGSNEKCSVYGEMETTNRSQMRRKARRIREEV
jgi:hypothetical protein